MAITKEYLNDDFDALTSFLSDSGFFGSVTHSESVITCKDSDNNTVLTIDHSASSTVMTVYASNLVSQSISANGAKPKYGYSCTNGLIIHMQSSNNYRQFIAVAKTNLDKLAVVMSSTGTASSIENASKSFYCVSFGDVAPLATDTFTPREKNQTQIVPFTTNNAANTVSYTPNAGYLAVAQYYNMGLGTLTINGDDYLTNGYWVIKD